MSQDFELYKLLSNQIENLRAAQRESRRFYTLVNITGASIIFGLQGDDKIAPDASLGVVMGLLVLCTLWLNATSYYTRVIRLKSQSLLKIEDNLDFSLFKHELETLQGSTTLPNSFAERFMISVLIALYIGLAGTFAYQAHFFDGYLDAFGLSNLKATK